MEEKVKVKSFAFNDSEGRNIIPKNWEVEKLEISGKGGVFEASKSEFKNAVCSAAGVQFDLHKCKFEEFVINKTSLINSKVQKCRFDKLHIEMDGGMPCVHMLRVTMGEFCFKGTTRKNMPYCTITSSAIEHLILDSCTVAGWSFNNCEIITLEIRNAKEINDFRFLGTKVSKIIIDGQEIDTLMRDDRISLMSFKKGQLILA